MPSTTLPRKHSFRLWNTRCCRGIGSRPRRRPARSSWPGARLLQHSTTTQLRRVATAGRVREDHGHPTGGRIGEPPRFQGKPRASCWGPISLYQLAWSARQDRPGNTLCGHRLTLTRRGSLDAHRGADQLPASSGAGPPAGSVRRHPGGRSALQRQRAGLGVHRRRAFRAQQDLRSVMAGRRGVSWPSRRRYRAPALRTPAPACDR